MPVISSGHMYGKAGRLQKNSSGAIRMFFLRSNTQRFEGSWGLLERAVSGKTADVDLRQDFQPQLGDRAIARQPPSLHFLVLAGKHLLNADVNSA